VLHVRNVVKGKDKVAPVLNHHVIKTYGAVEIQFHAFSTTAMKITPVPIGEEAEWAPEPLWTQCGR
jgi:hypothetical protein